METAPGGVFNDFNFVCGWILFQIFAVIGDLCQIIGLNIVKGESQRHIPEAVMVTIGLSISGNVDELSTSAFFREGVDKPMSKVITAVEQVFKGDLTRYRAIVKKES